MVPSAAFSALLRSNRPCSASRLARSRATCRSFNTQSQADRHVNLLLRTAALVVLALSLRISLSQCGAGAGNVVHVILALGLQSGQRKLSVVHACLES